MTSRRIHCFRTRELKHSIPTSFFIIRAKLNTLITCCQHNPKRETSRFSNQIYVFSFVSHCIQESLFCGKEHKFDGIVHFGLFICEMGVVNEDVMAKISECAAQRKISLQLGKIVATSCQTTIANNNNATCIIYLENCLGATNATQHTLRELIRLLCFQDPTDTPIRYRTIIDYN